MIGDSIIMLADEMPEQGSKGPKVIGGTPVSFFIFQENVDSGWKRAIDAGLRKSSFPTRRQPSATIA